MRAASARKLEQSLSGSPKGEYPEAPRFAEPLCCSTIQTKGFSSGLPAMKRRRRLGRLLTPRSFASRALWVEGSQRPL
jgi:hypothetical protein